MRILEYRPIGGRDFHATMECEHCGGTQELKTGYNDAYYHHHVIPAMTCKACGKNRAGEIPAESNDLGLKPVEARLAIRRFPPSKKVLDERKPPAPWILLTENPEPSPALKEAVSKTAFCAFGINDCPCLEPDIDHVFIHMQRMQIECHVCGAKEDIPLPGKLSVIQATIEKHKKCERKRGHNE